MTLIDLSHEIADGLAVYPHLPAARIRDQISREESRAHYAEGTTFQIGRAEMVGNLGTWVDAPFHRFADGVDLAGLPLERLADLDAVVVRAPRDRRAVDTGAFDGREVAGRAVLIDTGWSEHWGTPAYLERHPYLTRDAGEWLAEHGATFVGIDSLNVDDPEDRERPVHTVLLRAGIPIGENLRGLDQLPDDRPLRFHAVPVKLRGMSSFPVRAYAVVG